MEVELRKQPEKFLNKCTQADFAKVTKALNELKNLNGDIIKLQGRKDEYRLKIPSFRIIFTIKGGKTTKTISVTRIDTRGDAYKKG